MRGLPRGARHRGQPHVVTLRGVLLYGRQGCLGVVHGVLPVQVDLLEPGPRDAVEGIGVVSKPFRFVTRLREYQPVFHLHLGHDLGQAAEDLFR
jgi:hypothetical protein